MQTNPSPARLSQPESLWISIPIAVGLVAVMAWLRLYLLPHRIIPIGYGVPLVVFIWLRRPRLLWATASCFAVISFIKLLILAPEATQGVARHYLVGDFLLLLIDVLVITAVVHAVIV